MTFTELDTAMQWGWTVYYKTTANVVVKGDFPYSDYAVKWHDGALSYICQYEGFEGDFFVKD